MKRLIFILIIMWALLPNRIYTQILDTIYSKYRYMYIFDNKQIDSELIDSLKIFNEKFNTLTLNSNGINFISENNALLVNYYNNVTNNRELISLDVNTLSTSKVGSYSFYFIQDNKLFFEQKTKQKYFKVLDLIGNNPIYSSSIFNEDSNKRIGGFLSFPNSDTIFLYIGWPDPDAFSYVANYLYSINEKSTVQTYLNTSLLAYFENDISFSAQDIIDNHLLCIDNKSIISLDLIIKNDFTFEKTLGKYHSIHGFCFKKGILKFYFIETDDRKGERVLVPFRPKTNLELLSKKLYDNEVVNKTDLTGLDKHDMFLAKNLIYAKHNLNFKSEFLYAYFNIYSFYRNSNKEKLDNVDHLLTPTDKQNLKLIEERIKDLEGN